MITKPTKMIINEKCNRKLLIDRFYARQKFIKGKPSLVSRATPDILLWKRKGWIVPYEEEEEKSKKKIIKKKKK